MLVSIISMREFGENFKGRRVNCYHKLSLLMVWVTLHYLWGFVMTLRQ